jgi:hypothetical protein
VWAVKFATRHPNVALLDLSSFKCGHDAPVYGLIDSLVTTAGAPYAALHDIDANKPGGSIKIRVKTYAHSLKLHQEALEDEARKKRALQFSLEQKRLELLERKRAQLSQLRRDDASLDAEIERLAARLRAYAPAPVAPEPTPGLIQISERLADGRRAPASL